MKKKVLTLMIVSISIIFLMFAHIDRNEKLKISPYPSGFNFAFTVTDDPDSSQLDEQKIVYDYLSKKGICTTIALWIIEANRSNGIPDVISDEQGGVTCQNVSYLKYVKELQEAGFEIALHGASAGNDRRENTVVGYEKFKEYFGKYPKINIMHKQNLENIYWGKKVLGESFIKDLIGFFLDRSNIPYSGEVVNSEYFWGDYLKKNTKYVRLWGTSDINTLKFNPSMPYHVPEKPFVNYWFSFSDGFDIKNFNELISPDNVKKLVKERGACIAYTHFSFGFVVKRKLDKTFKERIDHLVSQKDGWFVPASMILDRLQLIKKIILIEENEKILIANLNETSVNNLTLAGLPNKKYFSLDGVAYETNFEGEIIIDKLNSGEAIVLIDEENYEKFDSIFNKDKMDLINFRGTIYIDRMSKFNNIEKLKEILLNKPIYDFSGKALQLFKSDENYNKIFEKSNCTVILTDKKVILNQNESPGIIEKYNMIFNRALLYIKHNYQ